MKMMQEITTKKAMKGRTFKVLKTVKGLSIDDLDTMREKIKEMIKPHPEAILTETDTAFELNNGQFWFKPLQEKVTTGTLVCGPTYAVFETCQIEYKGMTMASNAFETKNATYKILGEI